MIIPYRTQRKLKRLGLVLLVLALIGVLVWFCSVIFLERYIVYTRDGAHLDFSVAPEDMSGEIARPPVGSANVSIFYNEGADALDSNAVLKKLDGYYIDAASMSADHISQVWESLKVIPRDTPVMIELKGGNGYFYYNSSLADAVKATTVSTDAVDELIKELKKRGYYTIAKVSTFRDYNFGLNNVPQGLPVIGTPYLWPDAGNCYWLKPNDPKVLKWVETYVKEVKDLGFNEVLLADFHYPATDKVTLPEDKNAILAESAAKILETCAEDGFTISFGVDDSQFPLPEGRCRIYMENVDAKNVSAQLAQTKVAEPTIKLVFVAKTNDTRYSQGSVLRPVSAAVVLEAQKADREASKALAEKNKPGIKEKERKEESAPAPEAEPAPTAPMEEP